MTPVRVSSKIRGIVKYKGRQCLIVPIRLPWNWNSWPDKLLMNCFWSVCRICNHNTKLNCYKMSRLSHPSVQPAALSAKQHIKFSRVIKYRKRLLNNRLITLHKKHRKFTEIRHGRIYNSSKSWMYQGRWNDSKSSSKITPTSISTTDQSITDTFFFNPLIWHNGCIYKLSTIPYHSLHDTYINL